VYESHTPFYHGIFYSIYSYFVYLLFSFSLLSGLVLLIFIFEVTTAVDTVAEEKEPILASTVITSTVPVSSSQTLSTKHDVSSEGQGTLAPTTAAMFTRLTTRIPSTSQTQVALTSTQITDWTTTIPPDKKEGSPRSTTIIPSTRGQDTTDGALTKLLTTPIVDWTSPSENDDPATKINRVTTTSCPPDFLSQHVISFNGNISHDQNSTGDKDSENTKCVYKEGIDQFDGNNVTGEPEFAFNGTVFNCTEEKCFEDQGGEGFCHCDRNCVWFHDCCYDTITRIINSQEYAYANFDLVTIIEREEAIALSNSPVITYMDCVFSQHDDEGFWMIDKCPDNTTDERLRELCETPLTYNITNLPVDLVHREDYLNTYKNIHCAQCHGLDGNRLKFWNLNVLCPNTTMVVINELTSFEDIMQRCPLHAESDYEGFVRACFKPLALRNDYSSSKQLQSVENLKICQAYVYPVREVSELDQNSSEYTVGSVLFRNPHCGNMAGVELFVCDDSFYVSSKRTEISKIDINLKVYFEINPESGTIVKRLHCPNQIECPRDQVFDCSTSKCRRLYCRPGDVADFGRCVPKQNGVVSIPPSYNRVTSRPLESSKIIDLDMCFIKIKHLPERFDTKLSHLLNDVIKKLLSEVRVIDDKYLPFFEIRDLDTRKDNIVELNTSGIDVFAFASDIFTMVQNRVIDELNVSEEPEFYEIVMTFSTFIDNVMCPDDRWDLIKATNATFYNMTGFIEFDSIDDYIDIDDSFWEFSISNDSFSLLGMAFTCLQKVPSDVLNCSMIAYSLSETFVENGSLIFKSKGRVIANDQFYVYGQNVFVCSDEILSEYTFLNVYKYVDYYTHLSYASNAVSVFSTLLLIGMHLANKGLRNIHGLNLTAISVTILLTNLLTSAQPLFSQHELVCKIEAVIAHFLLLNMFLWMNVIGIEMARIFAQKGVTQHKNDWRRFLRYLFATTTVSLCFTIVLIVMDTVTHETSVKPFYGRNGVCWLTNGRAILAFVVVPVAFTLLVNVFTYGVIVFSILRQRSAAKKASKVSSGVYIAAFLKLLFILGFTWIIGVVAAFVDKEWLWAAHIVLNGLQGLSLLICTLVNQRFLKHVRSTLRFSPTTANVNGNIGSPSTSSSNLNDASNAGQA